MKRLLLVLCCLPLIVSLAASAEVYKWKDRNGKTQYSDLPPLSNIPYTTLSGKKPTQPADPAPGPVDQATTNSKAPADKPPMPPGSPQSLVDPNAAKEKVSQDLKDKAAQDAANKKQDEEKKEADTKAKADACKAARSRLAQFEQGGRIYRINEQGEREYYGDKEIAAEIQNAKDDVATNCE